MDVDDDDVDSDSTLSSMAGLDGKNDENDKKSVSFPNLPLPPPPDEIQACIRPNSPDGIPLVGKILDNCYVATGGGPWGITYGPLMGQEIAKQIERIVWRLLLRVNF